MPTPAPQRLWLLLLLLITWPNYAQESPPSHTSKAKILVIASYHPTDIWTQGQIKGLLATLSEQYDLHVDISIEYLYSRVPRGAKFIENFSDRIAKEYSAAAIETVITLDNAAFHLMKDYGDQLFPDTPVVFGGLNDYDPAWLEGRRNFTGITEERYGLSDTIKLASQLVPETKNVLIVTDRDQEIDYYLSERKREMPWVKFAPSLIRSWDTILEQLDEYAAPSIIYLDTFSEDFEGNPIDYREIIATLSKSKHPIFVSGKRYLGYGAVGGRTNSATSHGKTTAGIALQILNGAAPASIAITDHRALENRFDYLQLTRFGIKTSALPSDSIVINLPPDPYKKFLGYFLTALLFIAVQMILIALLVFNIRRRKITQRALESAKTEAEAANAAKSEFLAIISHEFRTPLNAILGFAQVLEIEKDPKEQERCLHLMRSNGDQLLYLIDNLLNYIYYGHGNVKLQHGLYQLENEFSDLKQSLQSKAEQKGLTLSFNSSNIPPVAKVDWPKLREVFTNLIDNAIKCTETGNVALEVHAEFTYDEKWSLRGTVSDTGCGIPQDELHRLFEPFTQADTSRTRKVEGVGLGLAICNRLVTALDGHIDCESELEQGTTFTVTVPISVPIEEPESLTI